jgi:RNA polymerase-binding transcription factor DksA
MTEAEHLQPHSALTAARADALERRRGLVADLDSLVEATTDVATDDEHDPEGATIAYERSRISALIAAADEQLAETQAGLERIATGSYGRCELCGATIAEARLEALPATRTCRECAPSLPRRGVT